MEAWLRALCLVDAVILSIGVRVVVFGQVVGKGLRVVLGVAGESISDVIMLTWLVRSVEW